MTKTIFAIVSDLHIGSTTALAPPQFEAHQRNVKEKQLVHANELQRWLWDSWTEFWNYVDTLAYEGEKYRKHHIVVAFLGDIIDGIHHNTPQVMHEKNDQIRIAQDILQPIVDHVDASFGILGTSAHAGAAGTDEANIYQNIGVTDYGSHFPLRIDGLVHDLRHHGRIGARPWTSQAAAVGVEVMVDYIESGLHPPDYIWRAHNHIIDDSGLKLKGTRALTLPSFQLKTDYAWKVSGRIRSDIGGFIMDGARLDDSRARYSGSPEGLEIREVKFD